jgi:hypothetical protein
MACGFVVVVVVVFVCCLLFICLAAYKVDGLSAKRISDIVLLITRSVDFRRCCLNLSRRKPPDCLELLLRGPPRAAAGLAVASVERHRREGGGGGYPPSSRPTRRRSSDLYCVSTRIVSYVILPIVLGS